MAPEEFTRFDKRKKRTAKVAATKILMGQVLQLKSQGYNYQNISKSLDISYPYAQRLYSMAVKRVVNEPAEAIIKIELDRLDQLLIPAMYAATRVDLNGNPIYNRDATYTVLSIMERRSKYLGLDRPVKTETKHTLNQKPLVTIYLPSNNREKPAIENGEAYYPIQTFPKVEYTKEEHDQHRADRQVAKAARVIEVDENELERFIEPEEEFVYGVSDE